LRPGLDDVGAAAIVAGVVGGLILLGLLAAWFAALGLLCALLVGWGTAALLAGKAANGA
jgi:hypothetical protein